MVLSFRFQVSSFRFEVESSGRTVSGARYRSRASGGGVPKRSFGTRCGVEAGVLCAGAGGGSEGIGGEDFGEGDFGGDLWGADCGGGGVFECARSGVSCESGDDAAECVDVWSAGACVCLHDSLAVVPERSDGAGGSGQRGFDSGDRAADGRGVDASAAGDGYCARFGAWSGEVVRGTGD
jgi:hypothetical protein